MSLPQGENIVCAAATVLLRTAARLLEAEDGIQVSGGSETRGFLTLSIDVANEGKRDFLLAVGNFLTVGLCDLQKEFPGDCAVEIFNE